MPFSLENATEMLMKNPISMKQEGTTDNRALSKKFTPATKTLDQAGQQNCGTALDRVFLTCAAGCNSVIKVEVL